MMRFLFFYSLIALFSLSLSYDSTFLAQCTSLCSPGCSSCQNFTCTSCHDGYTFVPATATCSANLCTVSNCDLCGQNGECVKCSNEYAVYDPTTNACLESCSLPNCQRCRAGSLSCELCNSGYALYSWDNTCRMSQVSNCLVYHDWRGQEYQCSLCESGFRPTADRTECIPGSCPSIENCQSCSAPSTCTLCRLGFSVNNGLCEANNCPVQDCLRCHASGVCVSCASGYKLSGLQCVPDVCSLQNCQRCKTSSVFCDECKSGFVFEVLSKKCVQITDLTPSPLNCESMSKFGSLLVCLNCLQGYKFVDNNHIKCVKNCSAGCSECESLAVCTLCSPGYELSSGTCSPYNCFVAGCSLCNSTGACLKCIDQFSLYNRSSGVCELSCSIQNCRRCHDGSSLCLECYQGYAINQWTLICAFSPMENCLVMHDWQNKQFLCSRCKSGFRPTQDQQGCITEACIALPDCQTCSNASTCTICRKGYSLSNGQCILNPCSIQNCLYCNSAGACLQPKSTHYITGTLLMQKVCTLPGCASCNPGSNFCLACQENYRKDIWHNGCVQVEQKIQKETSTSDLKYLWLLLLIAGIIGVIVVYKVTREQHSVENEQNVVMTKTQSIQTKALADTNILSAIAHPTLYVIQNCDIGKPPEQVNQDDAPRSRIKKLPPLKHNQLPPHIRKDLTGKDNVQPSYVEDEREEERMESMGDQISAAKITIPSFSGRGSNQKMNKKEQEEEEKKE